MYVSKLGALLCVSLLSALLGMGQADAQGLLERFVDGLDAATGAGANDAARSAAGNAVRSFGSITPDATSTYQQRMIDDAVRATGSGNGHSQRSTGSGGGANAAAPSRNTGPRVRSIPNLDAYNAHCIGGVSDAQWAECDRFNQRDAAQRRQERLQREEAAARAEQRRQRAEESRAREQAAQQLQRERAAKRERERQARQRQAELERNPSYVYGQMVRNARAASVAYFDARQIPFTPLVALVLGLVMLVAPNARLVIVRRRMIWNRRRDFGLEGSGSVV